MPEIDVGAAPAAQARKEVPPKPKPPKSVFELEVNARPVAMTGKHATGLEIKQAAIAQGVRIELAFVLQQELPNGSSAIIGDRDKVQLRQHLRFTAIAPDDNS